MTGKRHVLHYLLILGFNKSSEKKRIIYWEVRGSKKLGETQILEIDPEFS